MIDGVLFAAFGFGFLLGLRHAFDPDHIVAVSTIVSEQRSVRRSSIVGMIWGVGHTTSLLVVGIAILVLKIGISARLSEWMELGVAAMLILLGANAIRGALRDWAFHVHAHSHDGRQHDHLHIHRKGEPEDHNHGHILGVGVRPFCIGLIHGLAGSAGLMILVLGAIPSALAGLIYITLFGLGSIGGMLLMSSLISLPFVLAGDRFKVFSKGLQLAVGVASVVFGIFWLGRP